MIQISFSASNRPSAAASKLIKLRGQEIWWYMCQLQGLRNRLHQRKKHGMYHEPTNSTRITWPFPIKHVFSRMRSKGFRFTLGVWGLRVCSLDVAFASATVRNRPRDPRMAVPMGSSAEVVIFGGFRRVVASFRVAGVALRGIQTCSATCRKSFCVAQYFCDVFRRCVAVFVAGAALWACPSSFFVAGAAL